MGCRALRRSLRNDLAASRKPDWSRPLPRPLTIPSLMKLRTLADVRELLRHLPKDYRAKDTWRHVAKTLDEATHGADPVEFAVALKLVLSLDHVACR
jgi:hypothetical protein